MNYILKQIEKINMNLLGKVTVQNNFNQENKLLFIRIMQAFFFTKNMKHISQFDEKNTAKTFV